MGHFQRDCQYNGDKPSDSQTTGQTSTDSYDPVVGKWMTSLVATPPITAKAMQSLLLELNQQKNLKEHIDDDIKIYKWQQLIQLLQ